jgi:hypothetical protein
VQSNEQVLVYIVQARMEAQTRTVTSGNAKVLPR